MERCLFVEWRVCSKSIILFMEVLDLVTLLHCSAKANLLLKLNWRSAAVWSVLVPLFNPELSILSFEAEQWQTISHKTFLIFIKSFLKILFDCSLVSRVQMTFCQVTRRIRLEVEEAGTGSLFKWRRARYEPSTRSGQWHHSHPVVWPGMSSLPPSATPAATRLGWLRTTRSRSRRRLS